ncbi:hypothetical protein [Flavobacterium sp. 1355]|uniref:hypothetical protein n=1 Tax=Flavobacterium sp. 1355 TaxID=2806571 RepID=UPI001AE8D742|nr:hypothetical protein [Flavobacterium sp. 1355]MBP1222417.1 hypothetical protein [Flavobacterium sp. 1355]
MITDNYGNENRDDRNYLRTNQENDTLDPFFQKNAFIARDLEEELYHDDRDRRTLDESEADEDDSDDE